MRTLYDYLISFVGTPYRWGGDDPIDGFDCSGFVQEALAAMGEDPPQDQTAQALYNYFITYGRPKTMGLGALVFYGKSVKEITHITMMVNDWQTIGADGGGSKTVDLASAARMNAFIKIRPYDYRTDVVAIIMPNYSMGLEIKS